jgi:SAM-dependent methyltransferase
MNNIFNKDYFEDGVKNRISAYENYRWMPERTIKEATSIIKNIDFESVLDFGCAKGFMVYALRLLGKQAWGVDVSDYAIKECHEKVRPYLNLIDSINDLSGKWDLVIAKDVLEHIEPEQLPSYLAKLKSIGKKILIIVPLGDGARYRIREYEMDITHLIREPEEWWLSVIGEAGFKILDFSYRLGDIKENWMGVHPHGNAFIIAE